MLNGLLGNVRVQKEIQMLKNPGRIRVLGIVCIKAQPGKTFYDMKGLFF